MLKQGYEFSTNNLLFILPNTEVSGCIVYNTKIL